MKIIKKNISKDGEGSVVLRAEDAEDMFHAYNLILPGDIVRTSTVRKVVREGVTGSTSSQKVRLNLTIEIQAVDFDASQCSLRLKGRNKEENQYVKMGAYHTLDLEMNQNFTLEKAHWDSISIERLHTAANIEEKADIAAVVMSLGLAHICLLTTHMTITKSRIEMNIPKKRAGSSGHSKGIEKFFEAILQGILRHIDFKLVKVVLIASPAFYKEDFLKYMMDEAVRNDYRIIIENKKKFVLTHASSGHKHALTEILADPSLQSKLADTKATDDVRALQEFYDMMNSDPDRAYYGYKHVLRADEAAAIDKLFISDSLFRSEDFKARKRYVSLVESVKESGGSVRVFSSMHPTGQQLAELTGIAAILRFPLADIDEDEDDNEQETAGPSIAPPVVEGGFEDDLLDEADVAAEEMGIVGSFAKHVRIMD